MTLEDLVIHITTDARSAEAGLTHVRHQVEKTNAATKEAGKTQGMLNKMWSAGAIVAVAAFAAIAAAVAKAINTYYEYGKSIKDVMRLTGATSEAASRLTGQWRLSGVEAQAGAQGMKFFEKNLYAARDATAAQAQMFKTLGVSIQGTNGQWLDSEGVLRNVRERMAALKDSTERTALAVQLFGRGGAALLPWLMRSNQEIDRQNKLLKSFGLVWTAKDMKKWGDMASAQRILGMAMTALQIKVAELVMPLVGKLLPALTWTLSLLIKLPAPVYWVAAAFVAMLAAMKGFLIVKGILEGVGALKLLQGACIGTRIQLMLLSASGRGLNASMLASIGVYGALGLAIAGASIAVYEAVKAWHQWRDAVDQANKAYRGFQQNVATAMAANPNLSADFQRLANEGRGNTLQSIEAAAAKEHQQANASPWNPLNWFATGGDFYASKPTVIGVGEAGRERVTITPAGKAGAPPLSLTVVVEAVYGAITPRIAQEWARELADPVGREITGKMLALRAAT